MPTKGDILLSYRRLYRHGLQAVQYSAPARYNLRDRLRQRYRKGVTTDYDEPKIENTIEFLRGAAQERGLEHQIVKQLVHVWWGEAFNKKQAIRFVPNTLSHPFGLLVFRTYNNRKGNDPAMERYARNTALEQFHFTLRMLNNTMGLCLI